LNDILRQVPQFEILAGSTLVGHSALESRDPSMGCAGGRLVPTDAYLSIQQLVIAARDSGQEHLELQVRDCHGVQVPAQGGVHILDYSNELGRDGLEVEVLGIGYPLYAQLFQITLPPPTRSLETHN
jgi:hypothetical protein